MEGQTTQSVAPQQTQQTQQTQPMSINTNVEDLSMDQIVEQTQQKINEQRGIDTSHTVNQEIDQSASIDHLNDLDGTAKWYWSKGVPGEGEKPEWLHEGKTVEDMAKRADALRSQVSQFQKAPEEYVVNVDPEISEYFAITSDDPLIEKVKEIGLSYNLSQEGFDNLLTTYLNFKSENAIKEIEARDHEFKEMGINEEETFSRISNWAKNNLGADEVQILENMSLTAPQMKLMSSIVNKFASSQNLPGKAQADNAISRRQQQKELAAAMENGITNEDLHRLFGTKM